MHIFMNTFGKVSIVRPGTFCRVTQLVLLGGHAYKLYKSHCNHSTLSRFFAERIVLVWNSLPTSVHFASLPCFKSFLLRVDLTRFLKCT